MKVAAHPMLVAVALGLLGPNALAADPAETGRTVRGASTTRAAPATSDEAPSSSLDDEAVMAALEDESGPYWTKLELVNDEAGADLTVD